MIVDMEALLKAISLFGSQTALAKAIDGSPQTISNWIARGNIPAEHCPAIEQATGGAVRCEDLRPDVKWHVLRATEGISA